MRTILLLCLLALLSTPVFAAPQYSSRQDIATSLQKLSGITVADFNGDGKPDLAVTSSLDKTVLVYLNHGDGTFSAPLVTTLPIDNTTGPLVSGDFNEDGKQDVIVATIAGDQQDILLTGNGDGTFTQQASLPNSFGFLSASAVDINQDGHLDLISGANGSLYVYLGDGHGSFTLQSFTNQGSSGAFFGITTGDFNSDHHIDFITAAANTESALRFYAGAGDGSFSSPTSLSSSLFEQNIVSLASADFNGDGKLDILVGEPDIALVVFGNGDGTFQLNASQIYSPYVPVPSGSTSSAAPAVETADMDQDGKPDIVTADNNSDTVDVFLNDGTGTFQQAANFTGNLDNGTAALRLADLNGDGFPDIVVINYLTGKISIFLSAPLKILATTTFTASAAQIIAGAPLTLTAKVTTVGVVPTGSATLFDGSTTVAQQTLDSTGQATFTVSNLSVGQHALSVQYSGDKNYTATSTATLNEAVTDFQVALSSAATQTVTAGSTATYTIALTPVTGLMGTATLSCSGLPSTYTCANTTVVLNGQPATGSISVVTSATQQAQLASSSTHSIYAAVFGLPSLLLGVILRRRRMTVIPALVSFVCLTISLGTLAGCGGHSSSGSSSPVTTSFTIVVSVTQAGATLAHSVPATITVQ